MSRRACDRSSKASSERGTRGLPKFSRHDTETVAHPLQKCLECGKLRMYYSVHDSTPLRSGRVGLVYVHSHVGTAPRKLVGTANSPNTQDSRVVQISLQSVSA